MPELLEDPRDPLFKGCTRPAMMFGVPLVPLAAVTAVVVLVSVWTTVLCVVVLFPVIPVMRYIASKDDQQFRLLGLKMRFRFTSFFNRNTRFWKASAYSPLQFKRRK